MASRGAWARYLEDKQLEVVGSGWKQVRSNSCLPLLLRFGFARVGYCKVWHALWPRRKRASFDHVSPPERPTRPAANRSPSTPLLPYDRLDSFPSTVKFLSCHPPILTAKGTRIGGVAILCLSGRLEWKAISGSIHTKCVILCLNLIQRKPKDFIRVICSCSEACQLPTVVP